MMINYHVAGSLHPLLVFSWLLPGMLQLLDIRSVLSMALFFTIVHHEVKIVSGFLIIPFSDRDFAVFFQK